MYDSGKNSVKVKQQSLIRELQTLRKGVGLTAWKLNNTPELRRTIAEQTGILPDSLTNHQIYTYLLRTLDKLGEAVEAQAMRNAFAVGQEKTGNLTQRRIILSRQFSRHIDTIEAYENRGIKEFAHHLTSFATLPQTSDNPSDKEVITQLERTANAARNMITKGLADLYSLGPHASEILTTLGRHATPYLNSKVNIVLLPNKRGSEWYTLKICHSFYAQLKTYRIGVVSSVHDCETLMAYGIVDDVVKLNAGDDYANEIAAILESCRFIAHDHKKGFHEALHFTKLGEKSRQALLDPIGHVDKNHCEILEVQIDERIWGKHISYEYHWSSTSHVRNEPYAYWYAPGLTYLNHLTIDTSRFPQHEMWRFTVLPFLGPFFPSIAESTNNHYTIAANGWITQGQGVAVIWQAK